MPDPAARPQDTRWMRAALGLARRGLGRTGDNPSVGCVIVREGRVLGRATTALGGRPHAETQALEMARERFGAEALRGACAYVTLEPCAHHGRTPPCADALIEAGIARIVTPFADPDPRVEGRGLARLRDAGAEIVTGVCASEAQAVLAGYLSRKQRARPHLTLKLATSLDGRIAMASGESRWITGAAARARVHLMRAEADAVLIGSGTALADDPLLDVRLSGLEAATPSAIVFDRRLRLPLGARLLNDAPTRRVILLSAPNADPAKAARLQAQGAEILPITSIEDALAALAAQGIGSILCEGGATLAAALLAANCVDSLVVMSAGKTIGADGLASIAALPQVRLAQVPRFALTASEALGGDTISVWEPES